MIRTLAVTSAVVAAFLVVACSSSDDSSTTGNTNEKLQTKQDGSATGDGKTCSWAGTSVYASLYGTSPVPVPTYTLGDDFKSIDGCNECQCTAQGITCTVKTCAAADAGPVACPAIALVCNDGSTAVAGPNCTQTCSGDGVIVACPADAKKCADGTYVSRVAPNCDFAPCDGPAGGGSACPASVKHCPDGSYVGPTGPNCTFPDCPGSTTGSAGCNAISVSAHNEILADIAAEGTCTTDADCTSVEDSTSCSPGCSAAIAKASQADFTTAKAKVEANQCAQYKSGNCPSTLSACPAIAAVIKCVNNKCSGSVDP